MYIQLDYLPKKHDSMYNILLNDEVYFAGNQKFKFKEKLLYFLGGICNLSLLEIEVRVRSK
jgi:hypothetical protein